MAITGKQMEPALFMHVICRSEEWGLYPCNAILRIPIL
jgi:hypothetical protein